MLTERVDALSELLGLSRTRVSHEALDGAGELLERVGDRRRLSADHTVVALAGATGSGKSSLFNALTGLELSRIGVRRPTTSAPVACAWDPRGASGLLDRLGIAPKARFARHSALDAVAERTDDGPAGLVLLDLPDHDSAATAHRDQVDRVLKLVDVIVWVLDPEKYADAALHERYLRPLAGHADVTIVVLNQIDRLPEEAVEQVLDDLRRLLDDDGLAVGEHGEDGAMVMAVSALSGDGVPELRAAVGQVVAERAAASRRLSADVDGLAERLRPLYVAEGVTGLTDRAREDFTASLAHAVGAAAAGRSAERAWARAADEACGPRGGSCAGSAARGRATTPSTAAARRCRRPARRSTKRCARSRRRPWRGCPLRGRRRYGRPRAAVGARSRRRWTRPWSGRRRTSRCVPGGGRWSARRSGCWRCSRRQLWFPGP